MSAPSKACNILIHTCCAPCATYVFEKLVSECWKPVAFFYNPNIHPKDEYARRLEELTGFAHLKNYELITEEDNPKVWFEVIKGLESEKEGGLRCEACFKLRLEKTAIYASRKNFDAFSTVLTISPHKNSALINKIGKELENKYNIPFLEADFKKQDGFKKSLELSKEYNLYRQNYCGCIYSIK